MAQRCAHAARVDSAFGRVQYVPQPQRWRQPVSSRDRVSRPGVSRRAVLRAAGVALSLPWLESLAGPARAAAATPPKRFVPIFLPNGAPELWKPQLAGTGAN